jgi:uncharacterized protein
VFFSVRELEVRAGVFDVELPSGSIEFLDPKVRLTGALKAAGKAELVSESLAEIRVKGHLRVRMEADCDRCLEPAGVLIDSDFELFYRPVVESLGAETAIDGDEADMGFYQGDGVELEDVLREFVLLSLPMQRLCSEDCKGICPVCGQNRNIEKACHCQAETADDRWAALKKVSGLK